MSCLKHRISVPLSNQLKSCTPCNDISSNRRCFFISSPTSRCINITHFLHFQIVNTSNLCSHLSYCYRNLLSIIQSSPNDSSFPQEPIHRGESRLTCHEHSPPESSCPRTLILSFQIPNILRSCRFPSSSRRLLRTSHWPHKQSPSPEINDNVDKHMSPLCTNCILRMSCGSQILLPILFCSCTTHLPSGYRSRPTQRHQKLSHMSNTTICQQTFLPCLCLRSQRSNNHRKSPKQHLGIPKGNHPLLMPMMCPESQNCNFRQYSNPLRNTRPRSHINIRNPKVKRSCCLFPKKTHSNKPNSLLQKQRRFSLCPESQIFNVRKCRFSCLPVNKSNTLLQLTTPKSTQLKVFHSCFNRICTFVILSTQNNQRKTLLFQTKIHSHQISPLKKHVLSHQCQHCQIHIFSMTDRCCFLPSQRHPQYKSCCLKQNSTLLQAVCVFLKTSTLKYTLQRPIKHQKRTKNTPKYCPGRLSRSCMIRSCCRMLQSIHSSIQKRSRAVRVFFLFLVFISNSNLFCYRSHKSTCTIPLLNKKTKKQKKLWPQNYKIQSHFVIHLFEFLMSLIILSYVTL